MHAWLNSAFFKRLREILVEGKTIELQNFVVRKYRHGVTNQCFENDKHISLTDTSIIIPADVPCFTIPQHIFDFVRLNNIYRYGYEHSHLIGYTTNLTCYLQFKFGQRVRNLYFMYIFTLQM